MRRSVLNHIGWSFSGEKFDEIDSFRNELIAFQVDDFLESELDEICFLASFISVSYWCYEGESQIDKTVEIHSDNGISFTALEVLYKLHNSIVLDLDEIDHHFFEGLIPLKESRVDSPKFKIWQGS
ncbi:hypothetical protein [Pseudoalteromonas pernae]|uniref:hypothetical protein n=1 Tax=Pseudoalteromonas pernae TaxID=3118054 RepID=UPI003242D679